MNSMIDLFYAQSDVMDDIMDNFPSQCVVGLGMLAFNKDGKAESPTVRVRSANDVIRQRIDCLIFWRIVNVADSLAVDKYDFDMEKYPNTAVLTVQDEKGSTCGAVILSVVSDDFDTAEYGMTKEEFMDLIQSYFAELAPGVNDHFVGTLF